MGLEAPSFSLFTQRHLWTMSVCWWGHHCSLEGGQAIRGLFGGQLGGETEDAPPPPPPPPPRSCWPSGLSDCYGVYLCRSLRANYLCN